MTKSTENTNMASLQGSVEQNCEKLVCSICLSLFIDPRILPCVHTFCKTCLLSHIDATKKYNSFECPLCRDEMQLPKNGIDGIKKNIYIIDEINMLSEKIRTKSLCGTHPGEDLKLFCVTCGVRICLYCKFENHDEHKSRLISALVDERIHTLKSKLQATEKEASGAIRVLEYLKSKHDKIGKDTNVCVARLNDHIRQLHSDIDNLARDMKRKITGQKNNTVVKLKEDIRRLNDYIATFSSTEKTVSKIISGKEESVADILSAYDKLVDTLDKLQVPDTASGSGVDATHVDFNKGKIDKDVLKKMIGTVAHARVTVADGNESEMLITCDSAGNKPTDDDSTDDTCVICMDIISIPKSLKCGHKFCKECIDESFKHKKVCPMCGAVCEIITGDQPPGNLNVHLAHYRCCAGYGSVGQLQITYKFPSGYQEAEHPTPGQRYRGIEMTGYLPYNKKGRLICEMLQIAFKRRLVFTIGDSRTTGQKGVIKWNDILHKTDPTPNTQFGYPDPSYLDRVIDELSAKGVTEADVRESTDI